MTRRKATSREEEEEEGTTDEEVDLYDIWDELRDQDLVQNLEDTPVPITVTEILYAQRINYFCKEILSRQDSGKRRLVKTVDGVLRRLSPDDE